VSTGTEKTTTTGSQLRETPKVLLSPEAKRTTDNDGRHSGIYRRMRELGVGGEHEPPPQDLARIFRSSELSAPVNDVQKARALQSLQRSHGNQYVQRLVTPGARGKSGKAKPTAQRRANNSAPNIQCKLEVSSPGDALEREADRMADRVMTMPAPQMQAPVQRSENQIHRHTATETADAANCVLRAPAEAGRPPVVSPEFERNLGARRGAGQPLPRSTRDFFEPRFGEDLSGVRVHHDGEAADAAQQINAQAFTHGRDIYFNQGRYQPETSGGRHLLAHELAHTVQQGGTSPTAQRVHRELIQRNGSTGPPPTGSTTSATPAPTGPLTIGNFPVPGFKRNHPNYTGREYVRDKNYVRSGEHNPQQVLFWERGIDPAAAAGKLATGFNLNQPNKVYMVRARPKFGNQFLAVGNAQTIARGLKRPFWRPTGKFEEYQVDHVVDLVFSGWPTRGRDWSNAIDNMQLLDKDTNEGIGRDFERTITPLIRTALSNPTANVRNVMRSRDIVFSGFTAGPDPSGLHVWSKEQVNQGAHIDILISKPKQERKDIELLDLTDTDPPEASPFSKHNLGPDWLGSSSKFVIFTKGAGGTKKQVPWTGAADTITPNERQKNAIRVPGFDVEQITFNRSRTNLSEDVGVLRGTVMKKQKDTGILLGRAGTSPWGVKSVPGGQFAGYLDFDELLHEVLAFSVAPLSPIQVTAAGLDEEKGIVVYARILPTVPLLARAQLDLVLEGDDLRIEKVFAGPDFDLPRPFQINACTLALSIGTQSGLRISGRLEFGIERVGEGFLEASASTGQGFALQGGFDFDSQTFNPARVRLRYQDNRFSGEGELGIGSGKVRGIRTAHLTASYADGRLVAHGTAEFTIPGLEQGTLDLTYSDAEGLTIAGDVQLGTMPGIRSGSLAAQVRKPAGATDWQLSARGAAVPAIPGVESTFTVAYENGIFTAEARAAYSRGMLSGTLEAGVTNRPINPEGRPADVTEPTARLTPYGQGQLTIRIAPWLQGTIGVRILPNGEIEVSGAIGLPASLNIFPEKAINKNIFSIGIDIPIVGVAVAGQRIGVFATIRGGLDADAGIGPGQLRELGLTITYNPAHEDQTRVTGRAQLFIPAHAGLRLFVRGGLGVGIPIVSATAALEVGASLGLEGAVVASVEVDWLANRGLIIDARGEIYAQPKFKFDVTGMVMVEADLFVTTIELYSKRWRLAQFEYGSDLRFGITFPIHYQEGRPFDVSLSDVQFQVPHIDPMDLLTGLVKRI
jgi:hypothetical protein